MTVIDKSSYIPYYKQLADLLRQEITARQSDGQSYQLASENELAARHGLSRATVRHALAELEREGWIYRQKGVGSFTAVRRVEQDLTQLVSTTEDMRQRGWDLQTTVLNIRQMPAGPQVAAALELAAGDQVYELSRLRIVDQSPLSIQTAYLPSALCPDLEQNQLTGSLYRLLESRYGLYLWSAQEILRARGATDYEAGLLRIPAETPVMAAERTTYAASGVPVEYLEAVWRGDRYDFKVSLSRPSG